MVARLAGGTLAKEWATLTLGAMLVFGVLFFVSGALLVLPPISHRVTQLLQITRALDDEIFLGLTRGRAAFATSPLARPVDPACRTPAACVYANCKVNITPGDPLCGNLPILYKGVFVLSATVETYRVARCGKDEI
jgi:hypothetical protein